MSGAEEMLCGDGNEGCDLNSEDAADADFASDNLFSYKHFQERIVDSATHKMVAEHVLFVAENLDILEKAKEKTEVLRLQLVHMRHQQAALRAKLKATKAGLPVGWSVTVLWNGNFYAAVVDKRTSEYVRVRYTLCGATEIIPLVELAGRIKNASPEHPEPEPVGSGSANDPIVC